MVFQHAPFRNLPMFKSSVCYNMRLPQVDLLFLLPQLEWFGGSRLKNNGCRRFLTFPLGLKITKMKTFRFWESGTYNLLVKHLIRVYVRSLLQVLFLKSSLKVNHTPLRPQTQFVSWITIESQKVAKPQTVLYPVWLVRMLKPPRRNTSRKRSPASCQGSSLANTHRRSEPKRIHPFQKGTDAQIPIRNQIRNLEISASTGKWCDTVIFIIELEVSRPECNTNAEELMVNV